MSDSNNRNNGMNDYLDLLNEYAERKDTQPDEKPVEKYEDSSAFNYDEYYDLFENEASANESAEDYIVDVNEEVKETLEETKEIELDCFETTEEMITNVKIVELSEDVLELDFNGEIRKFEKEK